MKNIIAYLYGFVPKESKSIQEAVNVQINGYIEIFRPADLKFWPIIAGTESSTQRWSHILDLILKHLRPVIPSYVKDDKDFLRHKPDLVPYDTLLTTLDVTSLSTNIPHDLGTTVVEFWVEQNREIVDRRYKTEFIVKACTL